MSGAVETHDSHMTLAKWLELVDASAGKMEVARKALTEHSSSGHDPTQEARARENRTGAYVKCVDDFMHLIHQVQKEDPQMWQAIEEVMEGRVEKAETDLHLAMGTQQERHARNVLERLERLEAYMYNGPEMTSSRWSHATTARDSSPEHPRESQSPVHKRTSRRSTHEHRETSPSPPSVSAQSYFDTLLHEFKQILTSLACSRVSTVLVAPECPDILPVSICRLHASTP